MADPKEKIIFALDVDHFADAQRWVNLLKNHIGLFKVGKQLFTHARRRGSTTRARRSGP